MRGPASKLKRALLQLAAAMYALVVLAPSDVQASARLNASLAQTAAVSADSLMAAAPEAAPAPKAAVAPEAVAASEAAVPPEAIAASDVADATEASAAPEPAATTATAVATRATAQPPTDATTTDTSAQQSTAVTTTDTSAQLTAAVVAPTQTLAHLPTWVQVVGSSGSLYAADSSSDQVMARIPRYTFLRVLNGGTSRLQVQVYDENGTPGQTGWVTAEQVQPSAPGTDWLVAASATTLWSTSDGTATSGRNVSRFAPLQRLDGPQLDRIQVNVYSSDFTKVLDTGWVDVSATGPALPPQTRVPGPPDRALTNRAPSGPDQQLAFLDAASQAARQGAAATGVPASVTVAQAILESDWGRSRLAHDANNYFGMKVLDTLGNDGLVWMPTSEYDASGQLYQTTSAFRAYKSLSDSMLDHDRLLQLASRYSGAMKAANDSKQFAALIAQEGYSTDPAYADKLVALMDKYNLYQLDTA